MLAQSLAEEILNIVDQVSEEHDSVKAMAFLCACVAITKEAGVVPREELSGVIGFIWDNQQHYVTDKKIEVQ